jgi:DNA-binding NarL/FixJ family response regulator
MSARLDLFIAGIKVPCKDSIEFFSEKDWTPQSESRLVLLLQEVLALVRPSSQSLQLELTVRSTDPDGLKAILYKRLRRGATTLRQKLSAREIDIFSLIIQGFTNKKIAEKLFISFETVRSHRKNILEKMGASNTAMLINYYHQAFVDKEIPPKGD